MIFGAVPIVMAAEQAVATWEAEVTFVDTGSDTFTGPRGLAIAPNGTYALVANCNANNIARLDLLTLAVSFITDNNLRYPQDVAIAPDGSFGALVANGGK